jgi:hypothetical protein
MLSLTKSLSAVHDKNYVKKKKSMI